jgi:cytochrome c oxidase subunit IV
MREAAREEEREHSTSAFRYVVVWVALLALTALTYGASRLELGTFSIALALAIATVKAVLVLLFFMHLWEQQGANRLVFAVSILYVALLLGLSVLDFGTRFKLALPPRI